MGQDAGDVDLRTKECVVDVANDHDVGFHNVQTVSKSGDSLITER